ncbi:hypothetical protein FRZ67_04510 [Panacibacter ginsenosidivorans]|uniref:Pycsar effector protein domain-containing protein n=1 Tax=Panacibacter ginsenosidivorans TaxID=1813871 RepID=A0A5B8V5D5_9BACT|nr:Pycsar system effector family protein [Panacibacter ginsenosidivorans]QEC66594.1 hypothetical protein FRZ67_04510 [Panacibacter ginsenosidivorans]
MDEELPEETERKIQVKNPKNLSSKQRGQLFKIAFRNYIDLVSVADKKAGLLIQVNSIVVTIGYGFFIKTTENNYLNYLPVAIIMVGSLITIFFSVLASKPRRNDLNYINAVDKEFFFFGSFDRLDSNFKNVSWDKYSNDMKQFFKGRKKEVFAELLKESFNVRKVLSKKFTYLSIAYKVFFGGLFLGMLSFIVLYYGNYILK